MARDPASQPLREFLQEHRSLLSELHEEGKCARWGLSKESFADALRRSAEKHFCGAPAGPRELEVYLKSLHLEDLALACACSEGIEAAWEFFMAHFRETLRQAACAMLRGCGLTDDLRAAEIADSLYAELYGVRGSSGAQRKSLFEYFHGRSKLSTWLRSVLAQRQTDMFRAGSRTVSLDAAEEVADLESPSTRRRSQPVDPDRERYLRRVERALAEALGNLPTRERMILACYYVDHLTLAEIGRLLREHESTISRQLDRTRRSLRESVTQFLQRATIAVNGRSAEPALDAAQIELAFEYAVEDWAFDLSKALATGEGVKNWPEELK